MILEILVISHIFIIGFILLFFYLRESKTAELIKLFANEQSLNTSQLIDKTFSDYLKHIQKLETMVLPTPAPKVDQKLVQQILDMSPVMAEPNEIEKSEDEGIEITEQNLSRIPIGRDTKVVVEGDDFPTEVI